MELQRESDILLLNFNSDTGVSILDNLQEIEMIKKPLYSTTEIAEALGVTVSAIRMAKMNKQIKPDEAMSTSRHTWYTADELQRYAKKRGFYIVFTIAT